MQKPRKLKKRKGSGGGKATHSGVSFQAEIAAWLAVHILANKPLKDAFGIPIHSIPQSIRQESAHPIDDILVRFTPKGRLFVQATTNMSLSFGGKEPSKLEASLGQAFDTWTRLRNPDASASFDPPLERSVDSLVVATLADAPKTLSYLDNAFRCFDHHSRWEDAGIDKMNQQEKEALDSSVAFFQTTRGAGGTAPTSDELVELFSFIRIVRLDVVRGGTDQDQAIQLLRTEVVEDPARANDAWNHLLQQTLNLAKRGSSADKDGLIRELNRVGIKLRITETAQKLGLEQQTVMPSVSGSVNFPPAISLPENNLLLPPHLAERELFAALQRTRQLAVFTDRNVSYVREIEELAGRALDGDCRLASASLRGRVIQYAARAVAGDPSRRDAAEKLLKQAAAIDSTGQFDVAKAVLLFARDQRAAVRQVRELGGPEAQSQLFLFQKVINLKAALEQVRSEALSPIGVNAFGTFNILITALELKEFDFALSWAEQVPQEYCIECPGLLLLRAEVRIAACTPADQRFTFLFGLPLNLRGVQLGEDAISLTRRSQAQADLEQLSPILKDLALHEPYSRAEELLLWLKLQNPAIASVTRVWMQQEVRNPSRALQLIRLAIAFDIDFDSAALKKELQSRHAFTGWTPSEAIAALALELQSENHSGIADFLRLHRKEISSNPGLNRGALAAVEVQASAWSGDIKGARQVLAEHANLFEPNTQARLSELIDEAEGTADPLENAKRHFAESGGTDDLRKICGLLLERKNNAALADYAPELARRTRTLSDLRPALQVLSKAGRYQEVQTLINELSDIGAGDAYIEYMKARAFYATGDVKRAADVLNKSFSNTTDPAMLQLEIFASIESGDWGHLQGVIERIAANAGQFKPIDLVRFAHVARNIGSSYDNRLIEAALERAGDDPYIYLAGYNHAVESGKESSASYKLFEKAIQLSGPTGPVEHKSLQEIVEMVPGHREHENRVNTLISEGEVPLFAAARLLNVAMTHAALGRAFLNAKERDPRRKVPILAFHGGHQAADLSTVKSLALDLSAILTLAYTKRLKSVVASFDRIVVGAGTLTTLFFERDRIRFHQPSRIQQAKRIKSLVDAGLLRVLDGGGIPPPDLVAEVGVDLANLLSAARSQKGLVVRPGPLHRADSFGGEAAILGIYSEQITDTLKVLEFLKSKALLSAKTEGEAKNYILVSDTGMPAAATITPGTRLFLDDVAVSYLDFTNTLAPLAEAFGFLTISVNLFQEAMALINYENEAQTLLDCILEIKEVLAAGIRTGKVVVSNSDGEQEGERDDQDRSPSPTVALLRSKTPFDAVVSDDRFLGKWPAWQLPFGGAITADSIDVLNELEARGAILGADRYLSKDDLRNAGFHLVPLEIEELLATVKRAPVVQDNLQETPELRNIRESLSLAQASSARLLGEERWLNHTRLSIFRVIREVWAEALDSPEARSDWLLSIMPDIQQFAPANNDPTIWSNARELAAMETALFFNGGVLPSSASAPYIRWVESRIVEPLKSDDPWRMQRAIELYKGVIGGLANAPQE
jgi:hypothetical protein